MRAFTGPLFEAAKQGLTTLGNLMTSPAFQNFVSGAGKQIADLFGILGPVIMDVAGSFKSLDPILSNVGAFFQEFYNTVINDEPIGLLISAFANIGITIGNLIGPVLQLAGAFLKVFGIDFTKPKAAVDGIVVAISNFSLVMQKLADGSAVVATKLQEFATWLNSGGIAAETFRAILVGLAVAFAAIQIGTFIATIPALVTGFVAWAVSAGAAAIATIAATWPILLIIAAIALLVAGIILAVQHWGQITQFLQTTWASFSAWFMSALGAVGAFFTGIWSSIASFFVGIWTSITGQAQASGNALQSWWQGLWNGIMSALQAAWNFLVQAAQIGAQLLLAAILGPIVAVANLFIWLYQHNIYFKAMIDSIVNTVKAGVAWLQQAWTASVNFVAQQWQRLAAWAASIWKAVTDAISSAIKAVVTFLQAQWTTASNWLQAQWRTISTVAVAVWKAVSDAVSNAVKAAIAYLQQQWTTASNWLQTQWNMIVNYAKAAWAAVSKVFSSIWSTYISGPLTSFWNSLVSWWNGIVSKAATLGSSLISSIASGITGAGGAVGNAIHSAISSALKSLGFVNIPGFAEGVINAPEGQVALVGEKGPELMYVPKGASILPNNMLQNMGGGQAPVVNVYPEIYLDGQRLTSAQMPYITSAIRAAVGGRF
jgi:phage-related protein